MSSQHNTHDDADQRALDQSGKQLKKLAEKAGKKLAKKAGAFAAKKLLITSPIWGSILAIIIVVVAIVGLFVPNADDAKIQEYGSVAMGLGIDPVEVIAFDMVLSDNELQERNPNLAALHFISLLYEEFELVEKCIKLKEDGSGVCAETTTTEKVTLSKTITGSHALQTFFQGKGLSIDDLSDAINKLNTETSRVTVTSLSLAEAMADAEFDEKQIEHVEEIIEEGLVQDLFPSLANYAGNYVGGAITEFGENEIPAQYLPIYRAAESKFGTPWNLIAAIHWKETKFSTINPMISPVGAEGHTQFMPCTWVGWSHSSCGGSGKGGFTEAEKKSTSMISKHGGYGVDANGDGVASMWDINDAVFGTAKYLAASGAANGDMKKAIYTYNHADWYVNSVYERAMLYASDFVAVDGNGGGYPTGLKSVKEVAAHYLNNYAMSAPFAPNGINDGYHENGHFGIDLTTASSTDLGDPIYSLSSGTVVEILPLSSSAGYGVRVKAPDGYLFSYIHMHKTPSVRVNDKVVVGQVLGGFGNSANGNVNGSGGVHLDLKIKTPSGQYVDPAALLKKWAGNWLVKTNLSAYPTRVWKAPT